ncbi:g2/mitotic-specific cyclin cdc13 [Rhizoctonia solani AG-1 IA]|uniref:G2/mitotic-specific cyclin cdc13 n=1 Tax=Thanatephorus cucumeris (strain AG1-IA) TaxID=983506 RepID=L8WML3_THACA|nr:g2/mitotic-specific cyclin cdc13 [Rhizoctonia solani AG-1 IA]
MAGIPVRISPKIDVKFAHFIQARRSTRNTKHVDQNAGQPTTRSTAARKRAEASKPAAKESASTVALGLKRKALGDNTNAEKKKSTKAADAKGKGKVVKAPMPKAKIAANAASASRATPMKLVVEIPVRKRRRVQPKPVTVATKGPANSSAKASEEPRHSSDLIESSDHHLALQTTEAPPDIDIQAGEPNQTTKPAPSLLVEKDRLEDEPPAKRLRSSPSPNIPLAQPAHIEPTISSPTQDKDNPFEIGLRSQRIENQPWVDLDAEDENDPAMVSEYVNEIFGYMRELEVQTMPSSIYMNSQPELEWHLRGILMDWLIQVHERFRLLPETLFIAANLIDRFLSMRVVSLVKLQLVGITGLFVAAKYEEIMVPTLQDLLKVADSDYTVEDILAAEKYLLRTLGWDISYPNPMSFLRRVNKAEDYNANTRTLAKFLIEISVVEERLLKYTPSMLAAAGLWLARLILDKPEWDVSLEHYSGYTENKLVRCANVMVNFLLQPIKHESLWRKYSKKKYLRCAIVARKWAEVRWPPEENCSGIDEDSEGFGLVDVDLAAALPYLREQALARAEAQDL